jgi:hypothetical protein
LEKSVLALNEILNHYLSGWTEEVHGKPITRPIYETGLCRVEAQHVTSTSTVRAESVNMLKTSHYLEFRIL